MDNNCDNCYWRSLDRLCVRHHFAQLPKENTCTDYSQFCDKCNDLAFYKYNNMYLCRDCITRALNIKEESEPVYYDENWELIGTEDKLEEYISSCVGVEELFNE